MQDHRILSRSVCGDSSHARRELVEWANATLGREVILLAAGKLSRVRIPLNTFLFPRVSRSGADLGYIFHVTSGSL